MGVDLGFEEGIRRGWYERQQRAMDKSRSGTKVGVEALELCGEHRSRPKSSEEAWRESERVMHGDLRPY